MELTQAGAVDQLVVIVQAAVDTDIDLLAAAMTAIVASCFGYGVSFASCFDHGGSVAACTFSLVRSLFVVQPFL